MTPETEQVVRSATERLRDTIPPAAAAPAQGPPPEDRPLSWPEEIAESSAICTAYAHLAKRLAAWITESYDDTIEPAAAPTTDVEFRKPVQTTIRSSARFVNHCHRIGPLPRLTALVEQLEASTRAAPQRTEQRPYAAVREDLAARVAALREPRAARTETYIAGGR